MEAESLRAILNDDEKFTAVARAAFQSTDRDESGVIDMSELESAMQQISSDIGIQSPSRGEVEEVFTTLDTDKSGKLEFHEFKIFVRKILEAFSSQ